MSQKPAPRLTTNVTWNTLDDDRDPAMLAMGLSLVDTQVIPRQPQRVSEKRRTLDDMRALSEHIKRVAQLRTK